MFCMLLTFYCLHIVTANAIYNLSFSFVTNSTPECSTGLKVQYGASLMVEYRLIGQQGLNAMTHWKLLDKVHLNHSGKLN